MAYMPPGARGPRQPMPAIVKRLLWLAAALIGIPLVFYALFLAAVLVISLVYGPVRWN